MNQILFTLTRSEASLYFRSPPTSWQWSQPQWWSALRCVEGVVHVPPHQGGLPRGLQSCTWFKDHFWNKLTYCVANEDNFEDEVKPSVTDRVTEHWTTNNSGPVAFLRPSWPASPYPSSLSRGLMGLLVRQESLFLASPTLKQVSPTKH